MRGDDWSYGLSDDEFAFLADLVHRRAGIALGPQKRELVRSRLSKRVRQLGLAGFADYCSLVGGPEGAEELGRALNAITTNLTRFFREPHHFDHLRALLPRLAEAKQDGERRLRLWSAGCSTGEEPYSMAMVLLEALGNLRGWDARILATDIDTDVLARARIGRYSAEAAANLPDRYRSRHVRKGPGGQVEMLPELKALIAFKALNLVVGRWPMKRPFDAIFCRNVVIYFDRPTQKRLFDQLADALEPGGHLYIGHSETLSGISDRFELVGQTIYRRVA